MTERPEATPEDERERRARRQGLAYQGAFEAVFAILIAAGIGYWIDGRWDSSPWGLVCGTAIGFGAFVLRLVRLGRQLHGEPGARRARETQR